MQWQAGYGFYTPLVWPVSYFLGTMHFVGSVLSSVLLLLGGAWIGIGELIGRSPNKLVSAALVLRCMPA